MQLEGKRIVVTGAGRGIGALAADTFRERGAEVVTIDLEGAVDHHCDVSAADRVEAVFAEIGPITGLLNNAGLLAPRRDIDDIPLDEFDRMFAVNVKGTFLCARAAIRNMGDGASIVNVASQTAFNGSKGFPHYTASKGAIVSMTRSLATEWGPRGVRVNCVAPGFTPTPGSAPLGTYDPKNTPLGRVMDPADLMGTFCWLLSDDSAFVSGQTTLVNGGAFPY
ncbi:MAG TPA: SDR family oxidoreductase [Ilumatobacter sp.]|nr:SDR family oxidoreductase [Ilumatobacter sp.]